MMGKYYTRIILLLCLLFATNTYAVSPVIRMSGGGGGGGVNYLEDANCAGAWYMNADGSTGETDRCSGGSEDLTVSASDTIPTSLEVPAGYSGASRDFEENEADFLYHAANGATDIYGAEQGLTFCAWFKMESNDIYEIIANGTGGNEGYMVRTNTILEAWIRNNADDDGVAAYGATNITSGWHHTCVVHDPVGNEIIIYVDGSEDSNGASNPLSFSEGLDNSDQAFTVGAYPGAGSPFDGLIDEVGVWSRAFTPAEVLDIFTNGIDGSRGGND